MERCPLLHTMMLRWSLERCCPSMTWGAQVPALDMGRCTKSTASFAFSSPPSPWESGAGGASLPVRFLLAADLTLLVSGLGMEKDALPSSSSSRTSTTATLASFSASFVPWLTSTAANSWTDISSGGVAVLFRISTCHPNCVLTFTGSPIFPPSKHAFSNSGTICPRPNHPRSPPFSFEGHWLWLPASSAKSPPSFSCANILSASSSVFTRMCEALTAISAEEEASAENGLMFET
mmetsp:Transcript_7339/g.11038  ORF Transcript_7339/g.11038 Transcript_7339/m.11038 type:complete len:235 (+) Transcript_7339:251-955(+)